MNALTALVRAELKLYFSNRRAVLMSIVAPILIAAFFGSLFGGSGSKPAGIPIGVVDLDRSELSQRVVAALQADTTLKTQTGTEGELLPLVRSGKLQALAILPQGLGRQAGGALFGAARKPEITLHYDPSQAQALAVVRGLLAQSLMQEVGRDTFSASRLKDYQREVRESHDMEPAQRDSLIRMFDAIQDVNGAASAPQGASAAGGGGLSLPYTTKEIEAVQADANAMPVSYNSYAHSFAGMGVQFILMSGVELALGLLLMRRLGLWKRLRAAPLSRTQLLGSRIVAGTLISMIVFAVVYAVAFAFFGVRLLGSAAGFVLVLLCFSLLTACFGLLVAALGRTPEATRGLAILATLLMVMLGGAWVPAFIFPEWLQTLSLGVPTRWAVDALDAMTWRGQPFSAAVLPCAVMLGFSVAFAVIAVWRFRWEE